MEPHGLHILVFLFKTNLSKIHFRNTIRVSNSLNSDQDQHSVGPDLVPNCFQRLSDSRRQKLPLSRTELRCSINQSGTVARPPNKSA